MASGLIKFEARLPNDQGADINGNLSPQDTATRAFLVNLRSLTPYTYYNAYQVDGTGTTTQYNLIFGLLTPAQATSALGLLTTLNTALGYNVLCYTYNVTSQP